MMEIPGFLGLLGRLGILVKEAYVEKRVSAVRQGLKVILEHPVKMVISEKLDSKGSLDILEKLVYQEGPVKKAKKAFLAYREEKATRE